MIQSLRAAVRVIEFIEGRGVAAASATPNPSDGAAWAIRARFADGSTGDYLFRLDGPYPFRVAPVRFPCWPPPGAQPITVLDSMP